MSTVKEPGSLERPDFARPAARQWAIILGEYAGLVGALCLLLLVFAVCGRNFISASTFFTIANQIPARALIVVGMTYVLVIAGIDLSVGSVLAISAVVMGSLMNGERFGWAFWPAVAMALLTGAACGLFNGFVSVAWRLPSFIVTLGMLEVARGGAYLISNSATQYVGTRAGVIAGSGVAGLTLPVFIALAVAIVGQIVLTRSVFGRYIVAIGTNEEAVRLSGIDPRPVKIAVFALSGLLAAMAGVIETSRMEHANPNSGGGWELQAIAAAVVGGTSLLGGRGSVMRSMLGLLIIAVLDNGLANVGAEEWAKRAVTGGVIIGAVIIDFYRRLSVGRG